LGVEVIDDGKWKILKKDISITPASIIEALKLAEGHEIGICIFETSLGGTGLADVGIITNIAEDYTIANNSSMASKAKSQMFKSQAVACEIEAYNSNYSEFHKKTNTFGKSEDSKNCINLTASQIRYGFNKTHFQININDFQISSNNIINQSFELSTFAPSPIHVTNALAAVCASLTIGASIEKIKEGLNNFKGVKGRTTIREYEGIRIIEEINPGLNVTAVKKALLMIENMERVVVIFGGKYGVTCEEIDENSVSEVLNGLNENIRLVLVDKLGQGVKSNLNRKFSYFNDLDDAIKCVFNSKCSNLLIIYRSNFSDLKKR
jgi:UDP-N-acetylmuramyl pentapeptide synthase